MLFIFQSCFNCGGEIEKGEQVVYATKLSPEICWHPACFVCVTCEELLVDLTYCQHGRKLYCERHYAELIRPRCPACDEVGGYEVCGNNPWFDSHVIRETTLVESFLLAW